VSDTPERPDPDALLRRVHEEEARARRGKLKIFFGFAPGVGKTYRMLQVARDLVIEQKLDVVVGLVETHRRSETAAQVLGLTLLPRRRVEYRGRVLEELDLDAVLARRPALVLVDELAHTNAPGSRHAKRWQDIDELLDAGIDVYTTVNVQHLESLNDVIAQITHVRVRETVPDSVLDRADEIELVDLAPEELGKRLAEGKVYLPDQAGRAADSFFRRGNLLALRELALRRVAQHVDRDVLAYREHHGVDRILPAGERVLVCVGAAPSSARLIRAGARMAAGLRAPWTAAYVEGLSFGSTEDRERLDAHLRLAESLGATVIRLSGARVADVLLAWARKNNVTRIVIGKPTHSRLRDRLRGSMLDAIVRGSAEIDVHVITGDEETERPPAPTTRPRRSLGPYAFGSGVVAAVTGVAWFLHTFTSIPDVEMLYLLAVMIVAVTAGRGPSLLAAGLGVLAYDFFFVPPTLTLAVKDVRYVLTFAMMFGVGVLLSELAGRVRRQEQQALAREARTGVLYAFSRDLAAADGASAPAVVARHAAATFDADAWVIDDAHQIAAASAGTALDGKEAGVARWALEHGRPAGLGTDTLPGSRTLSIPLQIGGTVCGVLSLEPRAPLQREQRELLDVFSRQAAIALERDRLAEEARAATLRARTEEMRSSLLSAVSHDLRTPLAAITGAGTSLRDDAELPDDTRRELLDTICEEAERLERLVANLLDMTRLESGALSVKREWVPVEEIVGSALTRLERRLVGREVTTDVDPGLPLLQGDPVLLEQLLVNLLENALKYTPAGSPIDVGAHASATAVTLEVADRGPGIDPAIASRVFDKFVRTGTSGVGLGLAICRGIAQAHGGSIAVAARDGGGAVFTVSLPRGGEPPA
jgi:two-component system, OmpR family, sensor histidine kinase KdpD